MKTKLNVIGVFLLVFFTTCLTSCIDLTTTFDESLLIGKWKSGTLNYTYLSDGSGKTWDTADDVTEEEAQAFSWTVVEGELTHIYVIEMGGTVTKVYTLTELTATTLSYHDDFGKTYTFVKQTE